MITDKELAIIKEKINKSNDRITILFHTLGDPCRMKIFKTLLTRHDLCVGDIARLCNVSPSAASQQLRIMEMSGIVKRERIKQMVCYHVTSSDSNIKNIATLVKKYL
ncbi:MAG: metalloregulator ArsR/SmtB family transcription factor [bacterium]